MHTYRLAQLIAAHRPNLEELQELRRGRTPLRALDAELEVLLSNDEASRQRQRQLYEELVSVYASLLDASVESGDEDAIVDAYLQRYGELELAEARQEVLLHCKLAQLYELLATAPDPAWHELLRIRVRRRIMIVAALSAKYLNLGA